MSMSVYRIHHVISCVLTQRVHTAVHAEMDTVEAQGLVKVKFCF